MKQKVKFAAYNIDWEVQRYEKGFNVSRKVGSEHTMGEDEVVEML